MQKLKDEVRDRIIEAAVTEFSSQGYEKASMRNISKTAGISVSNTYNYYRSKEELFESIVKPVYDAMKNIFRQSLMQSAQKLPSGADNLGLIDDLIGQIMRLDARQRKLLIILTERSAGTRYEKSKEEMTVLLKMHLAEAVRRPGNAAQIEENQSYILNIIAGNYVNGLLSILKDYRDQAWAEANMQALLTYHLNGIKAMTG